MPWTNSIPNSLWSRTDPVPAYIIYDGTSYNLTIEPSDGGNGANASETNFDAADADYISYATNLIEPSITISPNLPSLVMPTDGEKISVNTADGGWVIGIYNAGATQLQVAATTIPLSDWIAWAATY